MGGKKKKVKRYDPTKTDYSAPLCEIYRPFELYLSKLWQYSPYYSPYHHEMLMVHNIEQFTEELSNPVQLLKAVGRAGFRAGVWRGVWYGQQ